MHSVLKYYIMKIVHLKSFSIHLFLWQLRHLRQVWWYFSTFFRHSVNSLGFWIPHRLRSSNFVRKQQEKRQTIFNFRTLCKLPSINLTLGSIPIQKSAKHWVLLFAVSKALDWVAWNPTRWFWVGPIAGGRERAKLGGSSLTPFAIVPPLKWLYWCPRAFNATPTPATKSAATLTFGGLCTTVAFWCCCPSCWNSTAHGRIANFGYLAWHSPRIIPFRWKRISILSSTIWGNVF